MISKSNARKTEVRGTVFRYKVSTSPRSRGVHDLNVTIQSERHNAGKLIVKGLEIRDSSVLPPGQDDSIWYPTVTRSLIDGIIELAIDQGWDFTARGEDSIFEASNEIFRLIPGRGQVVTGCLNPNLGGKTPGDDRQESPS